MRQAEGECSDKSGLCRTRRRSRDARLLLHIDCDGQRAKYIQTEPETSGHYQSSLLRVCFLRGQVNIILISFSVELEKKKKKLLLVCYRNLHT